MEFYCLTLFNNNGHTGKGQHFSEILLLLFRKWLNFNHEFLQCYSADCDAGYYCTAAANISNPTDGTTGDICPAGSYCPIGSPAPLPCDEGLLFKAHLSRSSERAIVVNLLSASTSAFQCFRFKLLYVIGKVLSGKLPCTWYMDRCCK